MKKFLGFLLMLIVIASICSAWPNNPETMAALKSNPQNYIYYGYTGSGGSLYLDKLSIGVERYEPPYYVIKFKSISYDVFSSNKYANIVFYLAYKISFYEKPISTLLQEYLKTGKWKIFGAD